MAASFLLLIHAGLSSGCFAERMVGEPLVLPEGLPVDPKNHRLDGQFAEI